ncbi:MAG: hypothetical protein L6R40_002320 [Gallowayella cf. fulva]|nr:MAG: hypothetical protein L6R40_002320 [Xanthomendoza cf. fulva]
MLNAGRIHLWTCNRWLPKRLCQFSCLAPQKGSRDDNEGHLAPASGFRLEDTRDIFVGDLDATLEAHRATNNAKLVRQITSGTDPGVKSWSIPRPDDAATVNVDTHPSVAALRTPKNDHPTNPQELTSRESKGLPTLELWPIGTIQHSRLYGGKERAPKESVQEYDSCFMSPTGHWKHPSPQPLGDLPRPWLQYLKEPEGDALQRLGNEILAYVQSMTLSSAELNATRKVAMQVRSLVSAILTESSCDVIGSYTTGLALPFSDIDFAVSFPTIEAEAAKHRKSLRGLKFQRVYRSALYKLHHAFRINRDFDNHPEIVFARVPIVRASHRATGQEVQIQIQTSHSLQQQHTLAYLAEYPSLQPLYVVLRCCLEIRDLSMPYQGGLGSYPILILIVNALKHASGRHDPNDLGSQLLHVLNFYQTHDLYQYGFSVEPPRLFKKNKKSMAAEERLVRAADPTLNGIDNMTKLNPLRPYLLCLQDPADPTNDLGRNAYAIKHIQKTFAVALQKMERSMKWWDQRSDMSREGSTAAGLLDPLIQANYSNFTSSRTKLERFGSSEFSPSASVHDRQSSSASRKKQKMSARTMLEKVIKVDQRKAAEKDSRRIKGSR